MSFTPAFRALSDRQVSMMNSLPAMITGHTNINTLSSLRSRDMVTFKYLKRGVQVVPTAYGMRLVTAVNHLNQTDYFETRKNVLSTM